MSQHEDANWDACPEGTIGSMVQGQVRERRIRDLKVFGGIAAAFLIVGIAVIAAQNPWKADGTGVYRGGMWCNEVATNLMDYSEGKVDLVLSDKITVHLRECEHCNEKYRALKAEKKVVAILRIE